MAPEKWEMIDLLIGMGVWVGRVSKIKELKKVRTI